MGNAAINTRELILQVAPTNSPVLLLGETGSGKEVAAQAIHSLSPRAGTALVSVNMATLNESLAAAGLFGAAKGAYTGAQNQRISRPSLYKLLEQNPAVRQPENIDPNEIREAWNRCDDDV